MPPEENKDPVVVSQVQAPRSANPYLLPGSILIAALLISGSIIYLVHSGSAGPAAAPGKPVNPLTLAYKGPATAFSDCVDSGKYAATVQADYNAGAAADVNSTPTTFVNGKKVVDATGNSVGASGQYVTNAIDAALKAGTKNPASGPYALTANDTPLGNADAPVVVIEYGDYQCPFCEMYYSQVQPLIQQYVQQGKVRFVFRDFPFLGQESVDAGVAAECARAEGKFWEYHDALYAAKGEDAAKYGGSENDGFFSRDTFLNIAKQAGL